MKILIIEDDEAQLYQLCRYVKLRWKIADVMLDIVGVRTLSEGLAEAADANVTVLDLSLPDSDEANTLRSIGMFPPPVIVLTGHDDPDLRTACLAAGADAVFAKGFLLGFVAKLMETMQKDVIRRRQAADVIANG